MSAVLRIEMVILAIVFLLVVLKTINRKKLLVQYALIWIILAIGMFVVAVIPNAASFFAHLMGIETTSNFIYLLAIISLLVLTFSLSVIISKLSMKIKNTIQMVSINSFLAKESTDNND